VELQKAKQLQKYNRFIDLRKVLPYINIGDTSITVETFIK